MQILIGGLFAYAYGGPGEDLGLGLTKVADGGYVISGRTSSFGAGGYDAFAVKTAADGALQWAKAYGGSGNEYFYGHLNTSDGGLLFWGYESSYSASDTNALLVKTDLSGNVQWMMSYGGSGEDEATFAMELSNGDFLVAGYTESFGSGKADAFLMRVSSTGLVRWVKVYGDSLDDKPWFIKTTSGGYLVGGYTASVSNTMDVMLFKVDTLGNYLWGKAYGQMSGSPNWEFAFGIEGAWDGGYVITGATDGYGSGSYDLFILKVNADGSVGWMKVYGGSGWDDGYHIIQTPDGGYLAVGREGSQSSGSLDFWMLKVDDAGNVDWSTIWGGSGYEPAASAWPLLDGFAVAGYTYSFGAGQNDFVLMKISSDGSYPDCAESWTPSVASVNPEVRDLNFTSFSPSFNSRNPNLSVSTASPATTQLCEPLFVRVEEGGAPKKSCEPVRGGLAFQTDVPAVLKLFSPDGRLLLERKLQPGRSKVNLKPGVYLWQLGPRSGKALVR